MIGTHYKISSGCGVADSQLVSFDTALLNAGVGNYNLVRLSSILPAHCEKKEIISLTEGSLLPIAYSTISSNIKGESLVSSIGVGIPADENKVGVIMEHSTKNVPIFQTLNELEQMIKDAFAERGWELKEIEKQYTTITVTDDKYYTTFACIAEWE